MVLSSLIPASLLLENLTDDNVDNAAYGHAEQCTDAPEHNYLSGPGREHRSLQPSAGDDNNGRVRSWRRDFSMR